MIIPGRSYKASGSTAYRYGFNGKENDNEVKGEGNQQDYGFRIYDPRLARFMSVDADASKFAGWSVYQMAGCSPVSLKDDNGKDWIVAFKGENSPRVFFEYTISKIYSDKVRANIEANGTVSLVLAPGASVSSLDAYQQAAYNTLQRVITSQVRTSQDVVSGSSFVTLDSYGHTPKRELTPTIDINDIAKIGELDPDNWRISAALLVHAVVEAQGKAENGSDYGRDHALGKTAERDILGYARFGGANDDGYIDNTTSPRLANNELLSGTLHLPFVMDGIVKTLQIGFLKGRVNSVAFVQGNTAIPPRQDDGSKQPNRGDTESDPNERPGE